MTNSILEMGFAGARAIDIDVPTPEFATYKEGFGKMVAEIEAKIPKSTRQFEVQTGDGTRAVEIRNFLLHFPDVFNLFHDQIVPYGPIVYAQKLGQRPVLGMVSPGYDQTGEKRLSSIRVLPLADAMPLHTRGGQVVPNEAMAFMAAGAALAESKGVGGHTGTLGQDFEHRSAIVGAVSLGGAAILDVRGNHSKQHETRASSSIAHGLSNPDLLGNVFVPDGQNTGGFPGYGEPLVFEAGFARQGDRIMQPVAFLHEQKAYAAYYDEAARITLGSAYQILFNRRGQGTVLDDISRMSEQLAA